MHGKAQSHPLPFANEQFLLLGWKARYWGAQASGLYGLLWTTHAVSVQQIHVYDKATRCNNEPNNELITQWNKVFEFADWVLRMRPPMSPTDWDAEKKAEKESIRIETFVTARAFLPLPTERENTSVFERSPCLKASLIVSETSVLLVNGKNFQLRFKYLI